MAAEPNPARGPAARTTDWTAIAIVVGSGIAAACHIGKVPPALPDLRADLGFGLVAAGWVLSMFSLIGVAVGIAMGAVAGRFGARRVAIFGLMLLAAASIGGAAAGSLSALLASRFAEGVGFMLAAVSAPALIVRFAGAEDRKVAFGLWGAYNPAGTTVMLLFSPLVLAAGGWRASWLVAAGLVAVLAAALALATRNTGGETAAPAQGLVRDVVATLRSVRLRLLALAFSMYTGSFLVVLGFLPSLLIEVGLPASQAALLTALMIAANAAGNVTGGVLAHRGVARWAVTAIASAVMGLTSVGIYASALPLGARLVFCLAFNFVGGWLPSTVLGAAAASAPTPHLAPAANGLMVQASSIGQLAGPPLAAALAAAAGGWQWTPVILVTAAAIGCAAALGLRGQDLNRSRYPG